jgi:hypothetical protein
MEPTATKQDNLMSQTLFLFFLLGGSGWAAPGSAITLVVHTGEYPSALAAATAEARVNWLDADRSDDTVCTECYAATEVQHYLRRLASQDPALPSTAEPFPIVDDDADPAGDLILLGNEASNRWTQRYAERLGWRREELPAEGFRLRTVADGGRRVLLLYGADRVGTLYAAYAFLERLGVRWYGPGEVNEEVPKQPLAELPALDVAESPAFFTRGFWAWEPRGNEDFFRWMARNRLNFWCVEDENKPLMKKLGLQLTCGGHQFHWRFLHPNAPYPYDHAEFTGDEGRPADPYPRGEYRGDANGDGLLSYSEAHPEWYGWQDGQRSFHITFDGGDNFCTSNPSAVTEFMKNIVQDLIDGQWAWADSINFWMLDGGRWCTCDNCRALGSNTDRNFLLVHRLRQEIVRARQEGRLNRDVWVMFLAYADVLAPPSRPLPEGFDSEHCIATFFPIGRCYVHAFADPTCTEMNAGYLQRYQGWALDPERHYRGPLCIGEYYNVSGYKNLPVIYRHVMAQDLPYYYRTGARHFHYMHVSTGNWGPKTLTNYQMARMLWNPDLDVEALWTDYFAGRYGPAAETMREFYATLERALGNITRWKYDFASRLSRGDANLFPTLHLHEEEFHPETDDGPDLVETMAALARCRELLENAKAQPLPWRIRARLREDDGLFTYAETTFQFYAALIRVHHAVQKGDLEAARAAFREAVPLAEKLEQDTESTRWASSHANAPNALQASYVTAAYFRFLAEFGGESEPLEWDWAQGPLRVTGQQLSGGGRLLFGPVLRLGQGVLSEHANFVYARSQAPFHTMHLPFRLRALPPRPVTLRMVGCTAPAAGSATVPIRLALNGHLLHEGPAPFPAEALGEWVVTVPVEALQLGENRLTFENQTPEGPRGHRPWCGIDTVEWAVPPG